MNVGQIKLLSWFTAALLTLGLSGYVYWFITELPKKQQLVDRAHVQDVLESVPAPPKEVDDLIVYEDVVRLFHETNGLNWTGRAPIAEVVDVPEDQQPKRAPVIPVSDLVWILMIQVDTQDPMGSLVFLTYTPKAGVAPSPVVDGFSYLQGDKLAEPHGHIRVEGIAVDGVTFAFDDEAREHETIGPGVFDASTMIVKVGPDGVRFPVSRRQIQRRQDTRPPAGETMRIGPNRFRIGSDDALFFGENYTEVLTRDVQTRRHRDPKTGRYDGVELTDVRPGSIAERHGAQSGDVIKSINGHAVSSVPEAINFAKNNANKYSTWEIVVERMGREETITYESQ